ncbi:MAG: hypothetical protein IT349_13845 [Candidatus Eisenbacteria bacterium]|nr:hypothetical protein [Candidatus Eisenbacteria bacterium]
MHEGEARKPQFRVRANQVRPLLVALALLAPWATTTALACGEPVSASPGGSDDTGSFPPPERLAAQPFTRIQIGGFYNRGSCFAHEAINATTSVILRSATNPATNLVEFYRYRSTDTGMNWAPAPDTPVFSASGYGLGFNNVRCVDLNRENGGLLHMIFSDAGYTKLAHATSSNNGISWRNPTVIFTGLGAGNGWDEGISNPSVIDVHQFDSGHDSQRRFLLAYGGLLAGKWSGIGLATAPDWNGPWTRVTSNDPANPAYGHPGRIITESGSGGTWQKGGVFRPRLIVHTGGTPSAPVYTLVCFYTGINGIGSGRPQSIAYATSTDWGASWSTGSQSAPIFAGTGGVNDLDGYDVYCPDVTNLGTDVRLYYLGTTMPAVVPKKITLMAAQAPWASLSFPPAIAHASPIGDTRQSGAEAAPLLTAGGMAIPNPLSEGTRLRFDRVEVSEPGEVVVVDVMGREVRKLWSGQGSRMPDELEWDGASESGHAVPAGHYIALFRIGGRPVGSIPVRVAR